MLKLKSFLFLYFAATVSGREVISDARGLRRLDDAEPVQVRWRQQYKPATKAKGSGPGYAFSVDVDGTGFEERLRLRNNGQLEMTTDYADPSISMGDWKIKAAAKKGGFTVERYGDAPFRIETGAPEDTLRLNSDGSISVAGDKVNGINITLLDERLATFESVITIEEDGTTTLQQGASVVGCFDVVGSCGTDEYYEMDKNSTLVEDGGARKLKKGNIGLRSRRGPRGVRRTNALKGEPGHYVMDYHTLNRKVLELEALVEQLGNQIKALEDQRI